MAFAVAIGLGACLLFQIQFLLARLILPWFGGAPAVWSTSLVVFQALLLAGYAYAHALARVPSRGAQLARHGALVAVALALLAWQAIVWPSPVTPGGAWKPSGDASPILQIVVLLASAVGVPFVLLSSTSPLLQRWYADASKGAGISPYRLYAVSNLGSLVGLVSYPLVVEPRLDLFQQGRWWAIGYGLFAAATLACARVMRRVPVGAAGGSPDSSDTPARVTSADRDRDGDAAAPPAGEHVVWLLLAAVPSAMLQATTTRLTQDVAAVPFLWMLPLATYLLTFILAFEYRRLYRRGPLALAIVLCAPLTLTRWPAPTMVAATLAMLATTGLSLHGELASRAPGPGRMTRYLLIVSAGGVLGSALVAFVAPVSFTTVLEYPLAIAVALLLLAFVHVADARHASARPAAQRRLVAEGLALAALLVIAWTAIGVRASHEKTTRATRSFFGIVRVRELRTTQGDAYRAFIHGSTMHGVQFQSGDRRRRPTAYFTPTSGIGRAMLRITSSPAPVRVGVLGLGIGTLAAFGRTGDTFTFYEIDPQVTALSMGASPVFTYLRDSAAQVQVVGGDGRLALERAEPMRFDLLAMDAFSSDAVPVHLITREALLLYARHLRSPTSLLAINVSNRYLDLQQVVRATGAAAGFTTVRVDDEGGSALGQATRWMLLARDPAALRPFGTPLGASPAVPWTDAWSNPLAAFRW